MHTSRAGAMDEVEGRFQAANDVEPQELRAHVPQHIGALDLRVQEDIVRVQREWDLRLEKAHQSLHMAHQSLESTLQDEVTRLRGEQDKQRQTLRSRVPAGGTGEEVNGSCS